VLSYHNLNLRKVRMPAKSASYRTKKEM